MLKSQRKKPWYIDFSFKYSNWAGAIYTTKKKWDKFKRYETSIITIWEFKIFNPFFFTWYLIPQKDVICVNSQYERLILVQNQGEGAGTHICRSLMNIFLVWRVASPLLWSLIEYFDQPQD